MFIFFKGMAALISINRWREEWRDVVPVSPKAVPTPPCGVDSRAASLTSEYKTKSVFKSTLGCSLTAPIVVDAYPNNEASYPAPLTS